MNTAMILNLASSSRANRQQMVAIASGVTFRRSTGPTSTTNWRPGRTGTLAAFVKSDVTTAQTTSVPLDIWHGCILIEVTDDEYAKLDSRVMPSTVQTRMQRVFDEMTLHPTAYPATAPDAVEGWVGDWVNAHNADNDSWLSAHTHPQGLVTASPAQSSAPAVEAEAPDAAATTWSFPYAEPQPVRGYLTQPNGEKYRVRDINIPGVDLQDWSLLRTARERGEHVFLHSDPGTGKTALVRATFGEDMEFLLGNEETLRSDYMGGYREDPESPTGYTWHWGPLALAAMKGVPFFADEIGVVSPKTSVIVYNAMDGQNLLPVDDRPGHPPIEIQPGFMVILATNPHAPGVRMSEALLSRCRHTIEFTTDFEVMRVLGVPAEACTAAENMLTRRDNGEPITWVPQARDLLDFRDLVSGYSLEYALSALLGKCDEQSRRTFEEVLRNTFGGAEARQATRI